MKILHFFTERAKLLTKIAAINAFVALTLMLPATQAAAATRYETGMATNGSLLWMKEPDLATRLDDFKALGVTWLRVDFSWYVIQPDNTAVYKWEMFDKVARVAKSKNMKIMAILGNAPAWAQNSACAALMTSTTAAQKCAPRSAEEFGTFAGAVAARFKGTVVRAWEIWNEPNLTGYWKSVMADGTIRVDPVAYAAAANAAATAIKQNYSDSVVLTGGLAPMFESIPEKGMRQSDFLAAVLPRLNANLFTAVGMHPYSWPLLPTYAADYNAFYTVDAGRPQYNLRVAMQNAGWGSKEIWGTEYGASTKGLLSITDAILPLRPDHVTEDIQAQIIGQGLDAWYQKANVGPLFVHADSDKWLIDHLNEGGFGLRRADMTKKPSYDAYQQAATRVNALRR